MELYHHGIKGQKWGVRRFQNPDGSRIKTPKTAAFAEAEKVVKGKASNNAQAVTRQPLDMSGVVSRSGLSIDDAIDCGKIAIRKYKEYAKVEPRITNDVVRTVERSGGTMYGLEHRMKQPTSLAGKIGSDATSDGVSFNKAANGINDVIRYTSISNTNNFTKTYNSVKKNLQDAGYEEVKCKNYFDSYAKGKVMHKAVQSTFANPDGYKFELQFQTPSSQAAKELKIPIYEERRKAGISTKRAKQLERKMIQLAEQVENPPNVFTIKSH